MRPFTSIISLTQARAIMGDAATQVERTEWVPLREAAGRVAADDVRAQFDVPPFDRAAMDGYAVRAEDVARASAEHPAIVRQVGEVFSGDMPREPVARGECVAIATGAPLPPGTDAVVMVEQTRPADEHRVAVHAPVTRGQHVSRRGCDLATGDIVVGSGTLLTAARVGALAALGHARALVYAKPRVFIASSGNELVPPGVPLEPGQIHEINGYTLEPLVRANGGAPLIGATSRDSLDALHHLFDHAVSSGAQLIVVSGGSSVGDRDLLTDVVRQRGEILFHGIAVKPGKPTLFARIGSQLVLGMPGNPTSCLSNGYILLVPLLRRIARLPPWQPQTRRAPLAREIVNTSDRHWFYAVRLECGEVVPAFKGSGDITSLADADGYIEIPADVTRVEAGTEVVVTLF